MRQVFDWKLVIAVVISPFVLVALFVAGLNLWWIVLLFLLAGALVGWREGKADRDDEPS